MSTVASVSFLRLFTYSNRVDYLFMAIGLLSAIGMGIIQPLLFYFVGNIYKYMDPYSTSQDYYDKAVEMTYQLLIWGSVYSVLSYIAVVAWIYVGSRQAHHFRREYLQAILRQDVAWFDARQVSEIPNSIANDAIRIEKATGDKLVALIFITVMVITSLIISLKEATQLTLLALAFSPLMAGGMAVTSRTMEKNAKEEDKAYTGAGGVAEEVLTEIKTVAAFNSQDYFSLKYIGSLSQSYHQMLKDGITIGISTGLSIGSFLGMLAATVVAGATMIRNQDANWTDGSILNTGKIIIVVFVCMMAFHNMATLIPCIKLMIEGKVAAGNVFAVVRTCPSIVSGKEDRVIAGKVEFVDVEFSYPGQKQKVLNKIGFSLSPGDCLAIVGETGCGKSTIVSLLMRFYDPSSGRILIDDLDLKSFNLSSFRTQCGLVSQEPVLFNDTIRNNLLYAKPDATEEELRTAVRSADALDFITEFDLGFDTQVGQKGSQLSGGEKQRVAIARAVLRKPKILLLDEATSALDKNTECAVQETLNELMSGCTTVMIAHRISTVRKANKVIVLAQGQICESGSQTELLALQGRFYHMVKMQEIDVGDGKTGESQNSTKRSKTTAESTIIVQQNAHFTRRFLKMTGKYWFLMVLGSLGAILVGAGYPCNGLMFGFEIQVLTRETGASLEADSRYYGGFFGVCAVAVFCGLLLQAISFPLLSAKSTRELRQDSFRSLLAFDLEFFDKNNPSALASRLSSDCQKINGLGGSIFGLLAGMVCSLVTGYTISGIFSWQIALIILLTLPVQIFSMIATFLAQIQGLVAYSYEDATAFASDCILNFRTVKAFSAEAGLLDKYMEVTARATKLIQKRAHIGGLSFGLGYGLLFYIYGLIFWIGAYLFLHGDTSFRDMNIAIFAAIMGTSSVFLSGIFAPDVKQGQVAAKNLFRLLDYKPKIDVNSEEGEKGQVQGDLEFVNVTFAYPIRDVQVLTDVSFRVPKGSTFAVVGTTGSGKSTIFQLLLRFYDPLSGVIRLDGRDLREFNIKTLRAAISLVSQEPVLFSGSIKDNISLGSKVTDTAILEAIALSQAAAFVEASADTYQRDVGAKGSHLSGGEKQRLAVARAIVRNPKIVILDEATAALDSDTEKALMNSLKTVLKGRTCMAIAHRVKTVADFDQIAVLSQGRLIELGTFDQLNAKRGYFYSLVQQM